jgi:hypothetical protein
MENLINLPIGAVDSIHIECELDTHYGYSSDTDVVGKVNEGEEYFVYKKIDEWSLIGNHQWIDTSKNVKPVIIEQPQEEILQQEEVLEVVEEPVIEEVAVEEPVVEEEVNPVEETMEEETTEKPSLFGRIKKIFSK